MGLRSPRILAMACLLTCPSTGLAVDYLKIENIVGGDNVVVLMDSRVSDAGTWWCSNDEKLRTTGDLAVDTRVASGGCNSEIAVFAAGNAMALSFPGWTNSDGDIHTITMKPIIDVPVSIWIANAAAEVRSTLEVVNATWIYAQNKVGVQFVPTYHMVYGDPNAVATIGKSCDSIGWIRRSAWYTPHTLNIYYVNNITFPPGLGSPGAEYPPGLNCDHFGDGSLKGDANITFIGGNAGLATLAHEIGHAFGLRLGTEGGHTNGLKGFDENNVMWAGNRPTRSHFSLGQAFRMNTQADEWGGTMLIANGLRPGPGRACPPLRTSDICPPLALDWRLAADRARDQEETASPARALANWLQCEHCEHDKLAAVTQYGQAVVSDLIAVLEQGSSRATREDLNTALGERYEQLVQQSQKNRHAPIGVSKEKFVELYLGMFDAQYRVRAAQALAAIGGDRTRAALEAAASQADRDDVRAAARESLRKLVR